MNHVSDPQLAVQLLREARTIVEQGRYMICASLLMAARGRPNEVGNMAHTLRAYVIAQIDPHGSMGMWMVHHLGYEKIDYLLPARLAWIDRMIHELETKGQLP